MGDKRHTTVELMKLDGTVVHPDGSVTKSNLFTFLDIPPGDYSDIYFTEEEARSLRSHLSGLTTGSTAAIPIKCGGFAVCPWKDTCPFLRMDRDRRALNQDAPPITPVGRPCLVEASLVTQWTKMYLAEFDVEPTNMIDFTCCRELAEVELMLWRLNQNLSKPKNAELVQDVVVGIDRDGNPLTRQETSAFFDAKEKLVARKSRLMKMMVGDRQEKYKRDAALKLRDARDPSSTAADLAGKIKLALEGMQKSAAALPEGTTEVLTPDQLIQLEGGKAG